MMAAGALVLAISVIPAYMVLRSQRERAKLSRYLRSELVPRNDCPIPDPFIEHNVAVNDCWDGALASGQRFVVIFGAEPGSRAQVANYIGIWLPPGPDLTDGWLRGWKERVAARGDWWAARSGIPAPPKTHLFIGPPESVPVRADRLEPGVILAWRLVTFPTAEKVKTRIDELARSLDGPAASR
jgi:hypothetical protein